ncbi:unnamed protein product [Trichobilharzia szidati]|nr:unnamed protein product [Trichobilharzia szidati]
MDELDSLLNELHQTNQKILQKNKYCNSYCDYSSSFTNVTGSDQQTGTDNSTGNKSSLEQENYSNGLKNSQPKNVQELNEMLADLDNFDYVQLNYTPQGYSNYIQSQTNQLEESSTCNTNTPTIVNSHSDYDLHSPQSNDEHTILAVKEASRQLDDLLYSLKQFKVSNHQSDSGAELPSSMSNSFIDNNSSSDVHQRNSQTPSNKSSTTSSHRIDNANNINTMDNIMDSSLNNENYQSYQNHDYNTYQYTDNGSSTTRLQRQHAQRVTVPKYEKDKSVQPSEHCPTQLLNSMLNDLSSELSQHGAKTNPRGECYACKKPINGTLITAIGKEWHPEHFTCASCRVGLVRQDFYERDDQAYCTQCHVQMFSPKCGYCGEAVVSKCVLALSRAWHHEHFFCYECHSNFNGLSPVHEQNGRLYCSNCYFTKFGTPCSGCQQPITDAYITALDMPWHKDCFTCRDCNKVLTGSNFHEIDGYAYCDSHYYSRRGLLCIACSLPITGRCVNALGKRYHPEHFICAYCLHPLQTGTFREHSGKPYCHQCFTQLFG